MSDQKTKATKAETKKTVEQKVTDENIAQEEIITKAEQLNRLRKIVINTFTIEELEDILELKYKVEGLRSPERHKKNESKDPEKDQGLPPIKFGLPYNYDLD